MHYVRINVYCTMKIVLNQKKKKKHERRMSLVFFQRRFRRRCSRVSAQWCAVVVSVAIYNIINALLISYRIRSWTLEYNYYTIYNIIYTIFWIGFYYIMIVHARAANDLIMCGQSSVCRVRGQCDIILYYTIAAAAVRVNFLRIV